MSQSNMNASDLLLVMRAGAKLQFRWCLPGNQVPRERGVYVLHYPDGGWVTVQKSAVSTLIRRGEIEGFTWSGGERNYFLTSRVVRPIFVEFLSGWSKGAKAYFANFLGE